MGKTLYPMPSFFGVLSPFPADVAARKNGENVRVFEHAVSAIHRRTDAYAATRHAATRQRNAATRRRNASRTHSDGITSIGTAGLSTIENLRFRISVAVWNAS